MFIDITADLDDDIQKQHYINETTKLWELTQEHDSFIFKTIEDEIAEINAKLDYITGQVLDY